MHNPARRLETTYRPKKFSEVLGQKPIVGELSALICRGKIGRHLLFTGDRGSGKTSLVRLYAKALSCENNDADGSPCGDCRMCRADSVERGFFKYDGCGLFEYDTAAEGGSKIKVERFMAAVRNTETLARNRVAFFDEAHALEGSDALLKDIEEGTDGIIYCFATTAPRKLGAPLLSRLWHYTVRALPDDLAIGLLREVADHERLSIDFEAIKLLAAVKRNYPRDLLIGLGQMASTGGHITAEAVKSAFGVNQIDYLITYFIALANGDKEGQAKAFAEWNETNIVKAQWISTFIVSLYYNHVLGLNRIIDPLIHASIGSHAAIVEKWGNRLGLRTEMSLRRYWQRLLAFWSHHRPHDESTASLAIALFEAAADERDLADVASGITSAKNGQGRDYGPNVVQAAEHRAAAPPGDDGDAAPASEFLALSEVRLIINRASYFAQQHGAYFDVHIEITPASDKEDAAVTEISALCADIANHFGARIKDDHPPFAAISFIERSSEKGVFGLMVGCLGLDDYESGDAAIQAYIEDRHVATGISRSSVRFELLPRKSEALSFHWDGVFDLCASYEEPEPDKAGHVRPALLANLGVSRSCRRSPRPIRHKRIAFFGAVGDREIVEAQAFKMTFLSAFDDRAYDRVRKGWERDEALTRRKQIEERKQQVAQLKDQFRSEPVFMRQEIDRLFAGWSENPKRRPRKWTGWWE